MRESKVVLQTHISIDNCNSSNQSVSHTWTVHGPTPNDNKRFVYILYLIEEFSLKHFY
jgi:hypothetical protein